MDIEGKKMADGSTAKTEAIKKDEKKSKPGVSMAKYNRDIAAANERAEKNANDLEALKKQNEEAAAKKKKGGRGKGKRGNKAVFKRGGEAMPDQNVGMMEKVDLKNSGAVAVGIYFSNGFLSGKSVMGVPYRVLAGLGAKYWAHGQTDSGTRHMAKSIGDGLLGAGAVDYVLADAISSGRLGDFLAPYLQAIIANGGAGAENAKTYASKLGISATAGETSGDKYDDLINRKLAGG